MPSVYEIHDVHVPSAEALLAHLRLTDALWRGSPSGHWAFRGQADAGWPLVPKVFRPRTNLVFTGPALYPPLSPDRQRREELRLLNHFLFLADRVGLPVPGDGQHLRLPDTLLSGSSAWEEWPWPGVLEVLAIAQHHGVPTRLLDFTHDPLTAAFWAAYSSWMSRQGGAEVEADRALAIWAVDLDVISSAVESHRRRRERPSVIWVTASRAENTFLHQQDALFLVDLDAERRDAPELEAAILAAPRRAGLGPPEDPSVIRLIVPSALDADVLRLLWNEFYHPARLMPTYDNVVATLEYRRALGL